MNSPISGGLFGGMAPLVGSVGVALVVGFGVGRVTAPSKPASSAEVEVAQATRAEESEEPKWQSVDGSERLELVSELAGAAAMGPVASEAVAAAAAAAPAAAAAAGVAPASSATRFAAQ